MINFYLILFYFILSVKNTHEKTTKDYECVNLLSHKDFHEKLQTLRKYQIKDKNVQNKNKYVFSYFGSSGSNKRRILENLFNISSEKRNFINLGFQQKLDLWFGYDKNNNFNVVLDIDLLENKEFLDNYETIYNYEKLVDIIIESTNSVIISLSMEDIYKEIYDEKEKKDCAKNITNKKYLINLPTKIEILLNRLNQKSKNMNIYLIITDNKKLHSANVNKDIINHLKLKYNNLHIYLIKQSKMNVDLLQKNNINKYELLINNIEGSMKEMNTFKNFDIFNENFVYNIYVIEESYIKCLNYFDKIYYEYEKNIIMGNVIENYGELAENLIKSSLLLFHLLTFEQTGTKFKDTIFKKLMARFQTLIRKQILKQLLLLEISYINKGKDMILNKFYIKNDKDLLEKKDKIENLKNSLIKKFTFEINKLITKQFILDSSLNNTIKEFLYQFEEKLEKILNNYYDLNQSPLKKLFDKRKIREALNRKKKMFNPSLNMNLTLTSLIRKSGYGNFQSYFIYDLGILKFVLGVVNDRNTPEVQQQGDKIPFLKFQPKLNLKLNFK
ncbi:conserved Plasmodium protein, unknown function [Plasmodium gallinaceum]|uniref:Uncharacterized protein n=1 Tax=Plasmodium gallinaceum TaxID=5849 RepID=A0A1J1GNA2_PLAGA|nr:conserved Plasmodium protein, unknown function [Plasmodium gallinaceum]CRG93820.1 conserved Plasmodium protein, unknown function [Plasmodium gallinaceum]